MPYLDFAKWFICLFLIGGSVWELKECVQKRQFFNGLIGIIGLIIVILLIPWVWKAFD